MAIEILSNRRMISFDSQKIDAAIQNQLQPHESSFRRWHVVFCDFLRHVSARSQLSQADADLPNLFMSRLIAHPMAKAMIAEMTIYCNESVMV